MKTPPENILTIALPESTTVGSVVSSTVTVRVVPELLFELSTFRYSSVYVQRAPVFTDYDTANDPVCP